MNMLATLLADRSALRDLMDLPPLQRGPAACEILDRSKAIVNRVLPQLPAAHGFYELDSFIAGSRRASARNQLSKAIRSRMTDKVVRAYQRQAAFDAECAAFDGKSETTWEIASPELRARAVNYMPGASQ